MGKVMKDKEKKMKKKIGYLVVVVLLVTLMASCFGFKDKEMSDQEKEKAVILGNVTAIVDTHYNPFLGQANALILINDELMKAAKEKYKGEFEIRNIVVNSKYNFFHFVKPYTYTATGDVVKK
jgi:hypothetical protein